MLRLMIGSIAYHIYLISSSIFIVEIFTFIYINSDIKENRKAIILIDLENEAHLLLILFKVSKAIKDVLSLEFCSIPQSCA